MLNKVTLLATVLALSLPALADKPSKPTQTIAKPPASKSVPKSAPKSGSKNASIGSSKSLTNFGSTPNSGLIGSVDMTMVKNAKSNKADQKKEAQAARGSTRGSDKVPGNPTVIPPEK